ncbi:protein of unknown function [Vibrio tapetis subsp. tapetis]|uniref:Uncharacterized protein n=1 Tax=Vibrio tapetis subsp. tapetis TaxID=1671868 RepID=A0A2N8Z9Z7_9VIBR|nr:protein of unknown function [Vibrio tapetis subsp. tapetis]
MQLMYKYTRLEDVHRSLKPTSSWAIDNVSNNECDRDALKNN